MKLSPEVMERLKITLNRTYEAKETKKLEEVNISDEEWLNEIKPLWDEHFKEQMPLKYDDKVPFIDKYGAGIMLVKTKPPKDKTLNTMNGGKYAGNYHGWFESVLLSEKNLAIDIQITDNATKTFEKWYAPSGEAKIAVGFARGQLLTNYADIDDKTDKYGVFASDYCKKKGVKKISELNKNTYRVIYSIKPIWQVLEATITEQ